MTNRFANELCIRGSKAGQRKSREEIDKRCKITRVEKDRNIDTKVHMVQNPQGQSPTQQGCFQSGTRLLPYTPVSSPADKKRKNTEEELTTLCKNELCRQKKIFLCKKEILQIMKTLTRFATESEKLYLKKKCFHLTLKRE